MILKAKKLILGIALLTTGYAHAQDNVIDQIIWVVGDEAILRSDVEKARMAMQARGEQMTGDPYCFIPEQLAVQKLFLDQAKIDSVEVANSDIAREVSRYENNVIANLGSKEKAEEYLGTTMALLREEWREDIRNNYLVSQAQKNIVGAKIKLTPSEIRKYYSQLSQDSLPYIPTTVEVQIITKEPVIPIKEIDAVKEQLRSFTNRVNSGEDFSTLAIMYSEDPGSANNGGELGFMGRAQLIPEFANVAFGMNDPKKVSNVVETEYGYHIIQLLERRGDRLNSRHILLRPRVPAEEIKNTTMQMDTLVNDIREKKVSFDEIAIISSDKDTKKNNGLMVNRKESRYYGTSQFTMEDLPTEVGKVVDTMKVGDISTPFKMKLNNGKEVVAIVKLRTRVDGHIANISDDYQALKSIVEDNKRQDLIKKWLQDKIKETYVYVDDNWKNCDFQYAGWIK